MLQMPAADDALVAELQRRLKVPRSTLPKAELVAVALRLALDQSIDPSTGTFWKDTGITSSDSRSRVKQYTKRMVVEGHLRLRQSWHSQMQLQNCP